MASARGALGELLGAVAVLATLVYLALQTRQNTLESGPRLDRDLAADHLFQDATRLIGPAGRHRQDG